MYHAMQTVGGVDEYHWRIAFDHQILTHEHVADLLNRQAEDLEVLRQWIRWLEVSDHNILRESRWANYIEAGGQNTETIRVAKRRIAALEGT